MHKGHESDAGTTWRGDPFAAAPVQRRRPKFWNRPAHCVDVGWWYRPVRGKQDSWKKKRRLPKRTAYLATQRGRRASERWTKSSLSRVIERRTKIKSRTSEVDTGNRWLGYLLWNGDLTTISIVLNSSRPPVASDWPEKRPAPGVLRCAIAAPTPALAAAVVEAAPIRRPTRARRRRHCRYRCCWPNPRTDAVAWRRRRCRRRWPIAPPALAPVSTSTQRRGPLSWWTRPVFRLASATNCSRRTPTPWCSSVVGRSQCARPWSRTPSTAATPIAWPIILTELFRVALTFIWITLSCNKISIFWTQFHRVLLNSSALFIGCISQ